MKGFLLPLSGRWHIFVAGANAHPLLVYRFSESFNDIMTCRQWKFPLRNIVIVKLSVSLSQSGEALPLHQVTNLTSLIVRCSTGCFLFRSFCAIASKSCCQSFPVQTLYSRYIQHMKRLGPGVGTCWEDFYSQYWSNTFKAINHIILLITCLSGTWNQSI